MIVSVPWSGFINRKNSTEKMNYQPVMFQSRGRDLLIGKVDGILSAVSPLVSVPWSGFINRKRSGTYPAQDNDCFSPVVGIY